MDVALQGSTYVVAFAKLVQKSTHDGMEETAIHIVAFRGENRNALRREGGSATRVGIAPCEERVFRKVQDRWPDFAAESVRAPHINLEISILTSQYAEI